MESKGFLESFERLKATRVGIKSAKEQVEKTVGAYDVLHSDLTDYTGKLNKIAEGLESIISGLTDEKQNLAKDYTASIESLKTTCSGLVDTQKAALEAVSGLFQTTCGNSNRTFSEKLDQSAAAFDGKVETAVDNLKAAYDEKLSKLSEVIDTFKSNYDKTLNSISAKSDQTSDNFKEKVSAAVADFKTANDTEIGKLKESLATFKTETKSLSDDFFAGLIKCSSDFSEKVNGAVEIFKNKNDAEVSKIETQITKLEQQVQQLDIIEAAMKQSTELVKELKQNLDQLGENLQDSQKQQKIVLDNISKELKESQDAQDKALEGISKSIKGQGVILEQQGSVLNSVSQGIVANGQTASSINNTVTQISGSLKKATDKVSDKVSEGNEKILEEMKALEEKMKVLDDKNINLENALNSLKDSQKKMQTTTYILMFLVAVASVLLFFAK